jgi:hypothetical protein
MSRGGARKGAGRKKGQRNRPKFQLEPDVPGAEGGIALTPAQRTALLRRQIALLVADGMTEAKISAVMAIPVDRLKACFAHELTNGREIVRAEALLQLDAAGASGSVTAAKAILERAGAGKDTSAKPTPGANAGHDQGKIVQLALERMNRGRNDK